MEATSLNSTPPSSPFMERDADISINGDDKATQVVLEAINEMDSFLEKECETILGSEEKLQELQHLRIRRKRYKKCACIWDHCGNVGYAAVADSGLTSLALFITALILSSKTICICSLTSCAVAAPLIIAGSFCKTCSINYSDAEIEAIGEEIKLEMELEQIDDQDVREFLFSQQYENERKLMRLPLFRYYIIVCIKLKRAWEEEYSESPPSLEIIEKRKHLQEQEEALANAISQYLDRPFERFEL